MFLSEFDYELPAGLIARHPAEERGGSRLLIVNQNVEQLLDDRHFADFPEFLNRNDLLVFNDTRVIRARLEGQKATGGRVEILLERLQSEYEALALIRASKAPKPGSLIRLAAGCEVQVLGRNRDLFALRFSTPIEAFLESHGDVPLPPYIDRIAEPADSDRYQTVYARRPGAVAAPTAGLHFDEQMLAATKAVGAKHAFVTLHVGAGTFQSLRDENVESNQLHAERFQVGQDVCDVVRDTRAAGGRVIAVGTTSVRALEAASDDGRMKACDAETELFIYPGYEFKSVDALLTNFHLPKSSLLMLVSAFAGIERTMNAYRHAVAQRYRFFSYGDAMLVFPQRQ
jgi:S-adenosylmethionine:tRNA ribosyltransferase-isomerase